MDSKGHNRLNKRTKELSCRVDTPRWAVWSVAFGRQSYETKKPPFLFYFSFLTSSRVFLTIVNTKDDNFFRNLTFTKQLQHSSRLFVVD